MKQTYPTNSIVIVRTYESCRTKTAAIILGFDPNKQTTTHGIDPSTNCWSRWRISAPYRVQVLSGRNFKKRRNIPEDWIEAHIGDVGKGNCIFELMDPHYLSPKDWDDMCMEAISASKNGWKVSVDGKKKYLHLSTLGRWETVQVMDNDMQQEYELYSINCNQRTGFKARKPNGVVKGFNIDNLVI